MFVAFPNQSPATIIVLIPSSMSQFQQYGAKITALGSDKITKHDKMMYILDGPIIFSYGPYSFCTSLARRALLLRARLGGKHLIFFEIAIDKIFDKTKAIQKKGKLAPSCPIKYYLYYGPQEETKMKALEVAYRQ